MIERMYQVGRYDALRYLERPLVILVGGATGTGKSTVATEVAYRLGITRVTSTDFVRETMRAFFSHDFMPSIHYSSFEAGDAVPDADDPLAEGFLDQARQVLVGVEASIRRALHEGWSMVLEGVHIVPGLLPELDGNAVVTTRPAGSWASVNRSVSASSTMARMRSAWPSRRLPASVSSARRADRSSSAVPASRSSAASCCDTADGV